MVAAAFQFRLVRSRSVRLDRSLRPPKGGLTLHFSLLEYLLWCAVAIADVVLLGIIVRKKLWQRFPFFCSYIAFDIFRAVVCVPALKLSPVSFYYLYWTLSLLGSLIHLAVIAEVCAAIFHPLDTIHRPVFRFGIVCAVVIVVTTFLLCFGMPIAMARSMPLWAARLNLLLTCLRFALFAFVAAFSRILGLNWRHFVFGIAAGMGIYSCVDLITTTVNAQYDLVGAYALHQISKTSYLLAMGAWCYVLAHKEPCLPITPEVRAMLVQLKEKLEVCNQIVGAK